jgi:hypothetical protein
LSSVLSLFDLVLLNISSVDSLLSHDRVSLVAFKLESNGSSLSLFLLLSLLLSHVLLNLRLVVKGLFDVLLVLMLLLDLLSDSSSRLFL